MFLFHNLYQPMTKSNEFIQLPIIIRPHRMRVYSAKRCDLYNCYRCSLVCLCVSLSVPVFVCLLDMTIEPLKRLNRPRCRLGCIAPINHVIGGDQRRGDPARRAFARILCHMFKLHRKHRNDCLLIILKVTRTSTKQYSTRL